MLGGVGKVASVFQHHQVVGEMDSVTLCNFCLLHSCSTSKYLAHPLNSAKHEKVDHPQISVFFIAHNPHPFTPNGWENLRYPP